MRQTREKTEAKPTLEKTLIFNETFEESPMRTPFGKSNKCQRIPLPLAEQSDTKKKPVKPRLKTKLAPDIMTEGLERILVKLIAGRTRMREIATFSSASTNIRTDIKKAIGLEQEMVEEILVMAIK